MSLISWLIRTKPVEPPAVPFEGEKKALKAELAQTVVTFERRRDRVHQIAQEALQRMNERPRP